MNFRPFLKIFALLISISLSLSASASSLAYQQIETDQARELARGRGVTVAVIDTGIDPDHPDLKGSLWTNPGESGLDSQGRSKASNGIDDDNNGFVDDLHGWNFVSDTADIRDDHGHGTHIAGLIASQNKSGFGTEGLAPEARLMILKYYDAKSSAWKNLINSIRAFRYAIQMKARIINYSGGGPGWNGEEEKVLKEAEGQGILVVAAAGNQGINTGLARYYPADYPLSNILSVTATDSKKSLARFANYNAGSVTLAAPGTDISSTLPDGLRGDMSGTSQATAIATGVAALYLSRNPRSSPAETIRRLSDTTIFEASLQNKVKSAGLINARRALAMKTEEDGAAGISFEPGPFDAKSELYTLRISLLDERPTTREGGRRQRISRFD